MARPYSEKFTQSFDRDWKYFIGEDHWPTPQNWRHMAKDQWKAKTVRNYLFQTVDFKAAVILDATPSIHAEPLLENVPSEFLEMAEIAVKHELERLRWNDIRKDMFLDGAVLGKGIAYFYHKIDPLSNESQLCLELVNPREFFVDPSASRLQDARYVVYAPTLDLSKIREYFPEKGRRVKPGASSEFGKLTLGGEGTTRQRTTEEILTSPGGEIILTGEGTMKQRKAEIVMVWIKDEGLTEHVREQVTREARMGLRCQCGLLMESDMQMCPQCGYPADQMTPEEIPSETKEYVEISRQYPYGRLIAYSGDVMLYDGPSPYEIETVFPFADFTYYRVNRRYWGYGDVALLKSCQMVADKNVAQLLDAMRVSAFGKFEYPIGADAFQNQGNAPGEGYAVPMELSGMARVISSANAYNAQLHSVLDETNQRDFQRVSGISDVSVGTSPTAPTSGVEVQARQRAAATRIGQHLKEMNSSSSDLANICFQMMRQLYVGPRNFGTDDPITGRQAVAIDMSMLPPGIAIKVTADPDDIERDRLEGQNVMGFITQVVANPPLLQQVLPYLDILLPAMGIKGQKARELQQRIMQYNVPLPVPGLMPNAATPQGAPPNTGPAEGATQSDMGSNQSAAYQNLGV